MHTVHTGLIIILINYSIVHKIKLLITPLTMKNM